MARIKDSSIRDVVAAADMVEVVGARTSLRRVGSRHTGRCPFHEERTPSFSVNAAEKLYYCFGCGAKGDVITFVRETEGLDFQDAVEALAERFRVTLEYEESSPADEQKRARDQRLYALLEQAAAFYERFLWETKAGEPVRAYLAGRGLREEVCREFRLGLSPAGGATLAGKAREKGFTAAELASVGLVNRRGNDYFGGRLMFPLADARGRVVGFGARRLRDDDPLRAKYVNSPEGELFHKQDILYGLDRARVAIAKQERAVVVEGYTDVLALRQAGHEPVVASMGTSLTERQLRELSRLTRRVYLCFDADAAGEAATLRGMNLALEQGFDVRVVPLPPGQDPADAADRFEELLGGSVELVVHLMRLALRKPDREEAFVEAREILKRFPDSPAWRKAQRIFADQFDLPESVLEGIAPGRGAGRGGPAANAGKLLDRDARLERDALAGCIAHPKLVRILTELGPEHFDGELHRRLCTELIHPAGDDVELTGLRAELDARAATEGIDEITAEQLLLRLRERKLRRELQVAQPELAVELTQQLARIRTAIDELAWVQSPRVPR